MKLKLINVVSIFIVIIFVGTILGNWQKEKFTVSVLSDTSNNDNTTTISDYITTVYNSTVDYKNRINELQKNLNEQGPIDILQYNKLLEDSKKEIDMNLDNKQKITKFLINNKLYESKVSKLNAEIHQLETDLASIPTQPPNAISNTKNYSIKSLKYGSQLSVRELSDKSIMIFLNNGCLTYDDNSNYSVKYCEITNPRQVFKINFFLDNNTNVCTISPASDLTKYLKIDDNGLSFFTYTPTSTVIPSNNRYPDNLIWVYSQSTFDGCNNKMDNKKIYFK